MNTLNRSSQNLLKTIHLIAASVWLTCVLTLMVLPLMSKNITSGDELYMYDKIYHFIDLKILTPGAIITLLTGLIYSIFTKWGFFKHGWLIYKWIITVLIILVGTFYLGPMVTEMGHISDLKRIGALEDSYYQLGRVIGAWAAIINVLLLGIAFAVSVYKPWKNIRHSTLPEQN